VDRPLVNLPDDSGDNPDKAVQHLHPIFPARSLSRTQHKKEHRKEEDTRTLSRKGWKGRGRDRQAAKARAKTQGGQKWKRKHHESKKMSKGSS